jgi:hypothetical protein
LPQGSADQYGDIDAQTLQLAGQNQYSDQAQLSRNYAQGVEAFKRQLAGRGALQSGDLQYGLDNADYARGQQSYDLGNQFGASARQAIGNFQGVVGQENQNQVNAISQAEQNVYSNPLNRPTDAEDAPLNQALTTQYGVPIYTTTGGTHYTIGPDGKPVVWSAPAAPAPSAPALGDMSGGGVTGTGIFGPNPTQQDWAAASAALADAGFTPNARPLSGQYQTV